MKVRNLARCGLMTALMVLCSWLAIPMAGQGAITLQTLGVFLILGLLGGKQGLACLVCYVALGVVGLPVFAGFQNGSALLAPNGGFLWGFLVGAVIFLLTERHLPLGVCFVLCQLTIYLSGSLWFAKTMALSMGATLLTAVVPYLIGDGIKLVLALVLVKKLRPHLQTAPNGKS